MTTKHEANGERAADAASQAEPAMPWNRCAIVRHNVPSKRISYHPIPSNEVFMNQEQGYWISESEARQILRDRARLRELEEAAKMMVECENKHSILDDYGDCSDEFNEAVDKLRKAMEDK